MWRNILGALRRDRTGIRHSLGCGCAACAQELTLDGIPYPVRDRFRTELLCLDGRLHAEAAKDAKRASGGGTG